LIKQTNQKNVNQKLKHKTFGNRLIAVNHQRILKFFRLLTYRWRPLPDYLIIGAQKCGTTAMHNYLSSHPAVAPPFKKEVHFFDSNFWKGLAWYKMHFPTNWHKKRIERNQQCSVVSGEASPYYIFHPMASKNASKTIPQAKLVLLLRNPVDRAFSHYHHERKHLNEHLSFEKAVQKEVDRVKGELAKIKNNTIHDSKMVRNYSYLARGIYIDQIQNWLYFYPRAQLLILCTEEFKENPNKIMNKVAAFLEIPSFNLEQYPLHHKGNYPPMKSATRARLNDYFRPHNHRLYEFLGKDLGWEKS